VSYENEIDKELKYFEKNFAKIAKVLFVLFLVLFFKILKDLYEYKFQFSMKRRGMTLLPFFLFPFFDL